MKILISAGPMRTYLDPIRYIQNSSSGVLGLEIARALKSAWPRAEISTMVGPVDSAVAAGFTLISESHSYQTSGDYETLLKKLFPKCELFISAAAVLDFEITPSAHKIKRSEIESSSELKLSKSNVPDFVGWMGHEFKREGQKIFAFSLDTENEAQAVMRAKTKVASKNVDWIFVNFASTTEGPEKPLSSGVILNKNGDIAKRVQLGNKQNVALQIAEYLAAEWPAKENS